MALVQLFCASGGRFNDFASRLIAWRSRPLSLPDQSGVLGDMRGESLKRRLGELRKQGYALFPAALPTAMCDRLMQFALTTPALVRRMDHEAPGGPVRMALYDANRPLAVRYDYPVEELLDCADVQALLADASLLALAEAYLGSRPRADVLSMWWHTAFHAQPDSEAAQFYHFDLDRIKWFKIFIYLTDVGPEDGPHSYVAGSHRTGAIPSALLQRGYVRLSDEDVLQHFGAERQIEFTAPRGTILVEDTRGLHKGKAVTGHSRLMLQLQFSNSCFGATYAKASMRRATDPNMVKLMSEAPDVYANYL